MQYFKLNQEFSIFLFLTVISIGCQTNIDIEDEQRLIDENKTISLQTLSNLISSNELSINSHAFQDILNLSSYERKNDAYYYMFDFVVDIPECSVSAMANKEIAFYKNGNIKSFFALPNTEHIKHIVEEGTLIEFHENGRIAEFELAEDLKTDYHRNMSLKQGSKIAFYDDGSVHYITFKDDVIGDFYIIEGGTAVEFYRKSRDIKSFYQKIPIATSFYKISPGKIEMHPGMKLKRFNLAENINLGSEDQPAIIPIGSELTCKEDGFIANICVSKDLHIKNYVIKENSTLYRFPNRNFGYFVPAKNFKEGDYPVKSENPVFFYDNGNFAKLTLSTMTSICGSDKRMLLAGTDVYFHKTGILLKGVVGADLRTTKNKLLVGSEIGFYEDGKLYFQTCFEDLTLDEKTNGIIKKETRMYFPKEGRFLLRYTNKNRWEDPGTGYMISGDTEIIRYETKQAARIILDAPTELAKGLMMKEKEAVYFYENGNPMRFILAESWVDPERNIYGKKDSEILFHENGTLAQVVLENPWRDSTGNIYLTEDMVLFDSNGNLTDAAGIEEIKEKLQVIDTLYQKIDWQWDSNRLYEFEEVVPIP